MIVYNKNYLTMTEKEIETRTELDLKPCPFCGNSQLGIHKEPSRDGTVIFHRIIHFPHIDCGVSMLDINYTSLINRWNKRLW